MSSAVQSGKRECSGGIQGDHQQNESIAQYDGRYDDGESRDFESSRSAGGRVNRSRRNVQIDSTREQQGDGNRVIQPVGGESGTPEPEMDRRHHCRNAEEQEQERVYVKRKDGMGTERLPAAIERDPGRGYTGQGHEYDERSRMAR